METHVQHVLMDTILQMGIQAQAVVYVHQYLICLNGLVNEHQQQVVDLTVRHDINITEQLEHVQHVIMDTILQQIIQAQAVVHVHQ